LYNLLVHKDKFSRTALTRLFEDLIISEGGENLLVFKFNEWLENVDVNTIVNNVLYDWGASHEIKNVSTDKVLYDTVGGSPVALSYLLEGGPGTIENTGYLLHAISAAFTKVSNELETIRHKYLSQIDQNPSNFINDQTGCLNEIINLIMNTYGADGIEILNEILENSTGFYAKIGKQI
jgi:hypothetical protein